MKKLFTWAVLAFVGLSASAQGTSNDSIRAKIRQIKLSEKYVYAEAAGTATPEEVRMLAAEELYIRIVDQLSANGKSKEEIALLRQQAEQYHQRLEYSNGPLHKSFAYIDKNILTGHFVPGASSAVGQTEPQPVQPVRTADPVEAVDPVQPVDPVQAVDPTKPLPVDTVAVRIDPGTPVEDSYQVADADSAKVDAPLPAVAPKKAVDYSLESAPDSHRRVVKDLLALDTYESIMLYLSAMKEDGRLMYGRISTLISPEQAYLIVIKDGRLVTVLNRGVGERTNLRTQQPDTIKNYKGHAVIWLKVFN